jgi:hypothetical protein
MRALWFGVLMLSACSERTEIALDYRIGNIDLATLVRVETYVSVDPSDARAFYADQPYRSVAQGVGYEVRDFDMSGQRTLLITHDSTLGYAFAPGFTFTLLPPAGEAAPPLVITARAVGASSMLGRTPDLPGKFAPGAHVTVTLMDERCNGVTCAGDEACCTDVCTNVLTSAGNCGACGMACAPNGDSCQGGNCLCAGGSACSGGKSCCAGIGCINLDGDAFNCGSCGHACNPGETCTAGQCGCNGGAACGTGGLCCTGSGCSSTGSCPCGAMACNAPNTCCDATAGTCVDLTSDNAHCGDCMNSCTGGLSCSGGACKCNGQICSGGDACCSTGCANLMSSTSNCGACGHACAPNETCTMGECKCGTITCASGQTCCGTACKNLDGDAMNCGACGKVCNAGEQCIGGACICAGTQPPRGCAPNEACCPPNGPSAVGGCFDLSSDQNHCGSCTTPCTSTQQCIMGMCHQTGCNPACTNGNTCDPTTLKCMCGIDTGCVDPLFCCGGVCVNKLTDPRNCGQCGSDVRPKLCCNGQATAHDENHCASCENVCTATELCCRQNGDWTCVASDEKNCGACGNICPLTAPLCCGCGRMGTCQAVLCNMMCLPGGG